MARYNASAQGKKAVTSGKQFEKLLDGVHGIYRMARIADIEKLEPKMVPGGKGPTGNMLWRHGPGGARLDFAGSLGVNNPLGPAHTGRMVRIEAKATMGNAPRKDGTRSMKAALLIDERGVQLDQIKRLVDRADNFGCLALLAWYNAGKLGLLGVEGLCGVLDRHSKMGETKIRREDFAWLPPEESNYLEFIAGQMNGDDG